jgi:hypothetical protein
MPMIVFVLTGWICAIAPVGCDHTPFLMGEEIYKIEADCQHRIDFFKHNTKYIISSDLMCERRTIEIPQS